MVATACPAADLLREFVLGQLSGPAAESLDAHLTQCPHCARSIDSLNGEDGLVVSLRSAGQTRLPRNAMIDQLRSKLRSLRRAPMSQALTLDNIGATAGPANNASLTVAVSPTPPPLPPETSALPHHVGRYRILGRLGAGGMGTVYKAHDPQLNRVVAVKVPRFDGSEAAQAQGRQRFIREARVAAGVRHPHVCPLYDVGEQDGVPYVVMAFVEGESLADRLRDKGRFEDCREAVALIRQVGEGLSAVHSVHIVHRDMKPGNILLDRATGQPLLTDFGLARNLTEGENLTADGSLLGTPAYMSPEQATQGGDAVGAPSDQYSLAVVLYQLVTGRMPFEGPTVSVLFQIGNKAAPAASQFRPGLDAKLEAILRTAMARKPEDRYPTVQAFVGALTAWLRAAARDAAALTGKKPTTDHALTIPPLPGGGEALTAADGTMALSPAARGSVAAETVALPNLVAPRPRRRVAMIAVAAMLLLAMTSVAGWFLLRNSKEKKDDPAVVNEDKKKPNGDKKPGSHPPEDPVVSKAAYVHREPAKIKGVTTWNIVATDDVKDGPHSTLELSPDGSKMLLRNTSSDLWTAWDLMAGERSAAPFGTRYDSLSADGRRAARTKTAYSASLGEDPSNPNWDTSLQGLPPNFALRGNIMLSPNGEWAAALITGNDYRLAVWCLRLATPAVRPYYANPITKTVWSPKPGRLALLNGNDVQLMDVDEDGKQISLRLAKSLPHNSTVLGGSFSPDGTRFASLVYQTQECWVWDVEEEKRQVIRKIHWFNNPPAWSPSGGRLACPLQDATDPARNGNKVGVFDAASGDLLFEIEGHPFGTKDILFTPDGRTIVTAGGDALIRFWDAANGSLRGTLMLLPNIQWLAFNPEGHYKFSSRAVELKLFKFQVSKTNETKLLYPELAEFEKEYGWKNDPSKVKLLGE